MHRFVLLIATAIFALSIPIIHDSELESLTTPQGNIEFRVYTPSSYSGQPVPLVVMLHGCSQDADTIAKDTEWNDLAEKEDFIVLYPQQSKLRNVQGCWNWFFDKNQHRGGEEPYLIAEATKQIIQRYDIDRSRVYICGMSAGAAMAVITAICYPEVFAAVGSHSGLEYAAADSISSSYNAMINGGQNPEDAAKKAYQEILKTGAIRDSLPAIIFHGTNDKLVSILNGDQTTKQFVILNEALGTTLERTNCEGSASKPYRVIQYRNGGKVFVEYWIIEGLGHAWSGDDLDEGQHNNPEAPNATLCIWEFFRQHSLGTNL